MNTEERIQKSESGNPRNSSKEELRLEEVGSGMEESAEEVRRGPEKTGDPEDPRKKHIDEEIMPKKCDASVRKLCKTINEVLHSVNHSTQQNARPEVTLEPEMQALKNMVESMYLEQGPAQEQELQQPSNPYAQMVSSLSRELSYSLTDEPGISKDAINGYSEGQTVASNQQTLKKEVSALTVGNRRDLGKSSLVNAVPFLVQNFASDSEDDRSEDEWMEYLVNNGDL